MFILDTAMPRKKNWRLSLAKKGNQSRASINDHGLVDPGHVNNRSELDPTSDITVTDTRPGGYYLVKKSTEFAFGRK